MDELRITPAPIHDYCVEHSSVLPEIFADLSASTQSAFPHVAHMQVGRLEGNFLAMLTKLTQAERILEFGTFTGFSSLVFALALPEQGTITTLDRDPKATAIARQYWKTAGIEHKVELILGDARESIKRLESEIAALTRKPYDLAFIDADKAGYEIYYEACLKLLQKGSVIITDNVLWSGAVLNPEDASDHSICAYNDKLKRDPRIELVMLPIRDGITVARIK